MFVYLWFCIINVKHCHWLFFIKLIPIDFLSSLLLFHSLLLICLLMTMLCCDVYFDHLRVAHKHTHMGMSRHIQKIVCKNEIEPRPSNYKFNCESLSDFIKKSFPSFFAIGRAIFFFIIILLSWFSGVWSIETNCCK